MPINASGTLNALILCKGIVFRTPKPSFARLCGGDNGVAGFVLVMAHVLAGGIIAAERYAAGLAGAQVHPLTAMFYAFSAFVFFCGFYFFYALQVLTEFDL